MQKVRSFLLVLLCAWQVGIVEAAFNCRLEVHDQPKVPRYDTKNPKARKKLTAQLLQKARDQKRTESFCVTETKNYDGAVKTDDSDEAAIVFAKKLTTDGDGNFYWVSVPVKPSEIQEFPLYYDVLKNNYHRNMQPHLYERSKDGGYSFVRKGYVINEVAVKDGKFCKIGGLYDTTCREIAVKKTVFLTSKDLKDWSEASCKEYYFHLLIIGAISLEEYVERFGEDDNTFAYNRHQDGSCESGSLENDSCESNSGDETNFQGQSAFDPDDEREERIFDEINSFGILHDRHRQAAERKVLVRENVNGRFAHKWSKIKQAGFKKEKSESE